MRVRIVLVIAVALAVGWLIGGASGSASPTVSVDVIAWPGESTGPLEWKLWRVVATEPMQSITLRLPRSAVRPPALRAVMTAPQVDVGTVVGVATVTADQGSDVETTRPPLAVGGCPNAPRGALATLRFEAFGACTNLRVDGEPDATVVRLDVSPTLLLLGLDLRLDSLQTAAGRLLPANPQTAVAADTSVRVDTALGAAQDTVREVAGGTTDVNLAVQPGRLVYGRAVTLAGTVRRGGIAAPGEHVLLAELRGSVANFPERPVRQAVTDASGHFETTIRPTSSALYAAWSGRAATSTRPRLNTLSTRARAAVVVRAPKPVIRKRHARRLRGGRVRAVIVVRNPIAGLETLQCRLYVWNRQVAARRFPRSRKALVFQVVAPRNAKVRAVIGRWEGRPIAARSSRIVRLWPRSARDRGSAPSRRR